MITNITEVRSNYYCVEEHCYYIDVWVDYNDDGFSVAKVYDDPLEVSCIPGKEMYFAQAIVQDEIVSLIKYILEK